MEKNEKKSKIIKLENYISSNMENTKEKLSNSGLNVITLGTGKYVINQYPLKNINVVKGEKIFLVSNKDDYIMPDVTNWSISDIKTFANLTNINLNIEGNGFVKTQSIEVGAPLTKDSELNVTLQ